MKTLFTLLAFTTLLCTGVRAQHADPEALETALNRAFEKGNLMVALSAIDWRTGLAIAATRLDAGQTISVELYLSRHHDYAFIATAATETTDVDLYLRDTSGTIIASDKADDGTPIIEFQVHETGNYHLQLHVSEADDPVNHVALALLSSEGHSIIEGDYRRQTDQFFTATSSLLNELPKRAFAGGSGCWAIQGYMLPGGRGVTVSALKSISENLTIAATPGLEIAKLSLYFADRQGRIVAQTRAKTPFPLLRVATEVDQPYDLRIESSSHKVPELVLLGLFNH